MGDASGAGLGCPHCPAQHTWRSLLVTHCWAGLGWAGLGWAGWMLRPLLLTKITDCGGEVQQRCHSHWSLGSRRLQERLGVCCAHCAHCALCRPLWPGLNKTEQCGPAQAAAAGWAHTPHLARPDTAGVLGLVILQHSPAVTRHWPGDSANTRTGTWGHRSTSGPCHHKVATGHHQLLGQLAALVICRYVDM